MSDIASAPTTGTGEEREAAGVTNRMAIAVLALVGLLVSTYLLLYKLGVLGSLVCGTGGCEYVQSSRWAMFLGVPVAGWGVAGYLVLLVIAIVGMQPERARDRTIAAVLLAFAAGGLAFTLYLNALEAFVIHAWCRWCLGSAAIITLIFLFALPEIPRLRKGP